VSNITNDSWGSWGATLVDGLDTALLMGVLDGPALERVRAHVAAIDWRKRPEYSASFFEVTIRYLGGLLGAFEVSRDRLYLEKAAELADALLPSFNSPTGLPRSKINPATGEARNNAWAAGGASILAEVASCQLELEYLSFHTGEPKYAQAARKVMEVLDTASASSPVPGLIPTYIDADTGRFVNAQFSFGSFGDSAYEYLLKAWLLTDRRDQRALRLFNRAMTAMEDKMLKSFWVNFPVEKDEEEGKPQTAVATSPRTVTKRFGFLGELNGGSDKFVMEHLTCFMPGLLALAVSSGADDTFKRERGWPTTPNKVITHDHDKTLTLTADASVGTGENSDDGSLPAAGELTPEELVLRSAASRHAGAADALLNTCMAVYAQTATGLPPETWSFDPRRMPFQQQQNSAVAGSAQQAQKPDPNARGGALSRVFQRRMRRGGADAAQSSSPSSQPLAVMDPSSLSDVSPSLDPLDPSSDGGGSLLKLDAESMVVGSLFHLLERKYVLRPEALESLFLAFRLTGEERFREAAWEIFLNLQRNCRTPAAFSGIKDCDFGRPPASSSSSKGGQQTPFNPRAFQRSRPVGGGGDGASNWRDSAESFFYAETMKYLWLIFSPPDVLPLDQVVFNTEAHPLGVLVQHGRPGAVAAEGVAAPPAQEL